MEPLPSRRPILLLDDCLDTRQLLTALVPELNWVCCSTIREAQDILKSQPISMAVLDKKLPDGDGLEFFSGMKEQFGTLNLPVIFISGGASARERARAFDLDAEDFITKPFDFAETRSRILARLSLNRPALQQNRMRQSEAVIRVGDVVIDLRTRRVSKKADGKDQLLELTSIEFRLLHLISGHIGQSFSRADLYAKVWPDTKVSERAVDSHLSRLRKKLLITRLRVLATHGVGYRLEVEAG